MLHTLHTQCLEKGVFAVKWEVLSVWGKFGKDVNGHIDYLGGV